MVVLNNLAVELLQMILADGLSISQERVDSPSHETFGANDWVSSASILTVCKLWMRIGTPLLYETVIIRSPGQSRALSGAFSQSQNFARHVKVLRLEGAYPYLALTMPLCTNLTTLVLFLDIYQNIDVAPLCNSLVYIDPIEVILREMTTNNQKSRKTFQALSEAIPMWTRLVIFEFPYDTVLGAVAQGTTDRVQDANRQLCIELLDVLVESASLRTLYCPVLDLSSETWKLLAARPWITYKFRHSPHCVLAYVWNDITKNLRAEMSTLRIELVKIKDSYLPPPQITESHQWPQVELTVNQELVEAIPAAVWIVIFRFATEWYQDEASHRDFLDAEPGRQVNATRKSISLVCWQFKRIVFPLIFETPLIFSLEALKTFSAAITETPVLGQRVQVLCLGYLAKPGDDEKDSWHKQLENLLHALLPHLTCLKVFDTTQTISRFNQCLISSAVFTLLGMSSGKTLQTIQGLCFSSEFRPLSFSALALFQCLENFGSFHPQTNYSDPGIMAHADTLGALRTLRLPGSGWIFNTFCGIRLSGVTSISVIGVQEGDVERILESAPNVTHVKFEGVANFRVVFKRTPKLLHVEWNSTQRQKRIINSFIPQRAAHRKLEVFTIHGTFPWSDKERNNVVDLLFSCLEFAHFPSLKSVHLTGYRWPIEERAISKDHLPMIAIQKKQIHGVDIKDMSGKPWRPRVQVQRSS